MLKKIKELVKKNFENQTQIIKNTNELVWAEVFHDSIKECPELNNFSISPGRWAGNYSFFYVLFRVLKDAKPKSILEFGLGESSKFISLFNDKYNMDAEHLILENDKTWIDFFLSSNKLLPNSKINQHELVKRRFEEFEYNSYQNISDYSSKKFDFYLVDGPLGSERYSRFDIFTLIESIAVQQVDFIILIDDTNRKGEIDTVNKLTELLKKNGVLYTKSYFEGMKNQLLITTGKYKFISSI
ncbi:hypothetical protein [Cecembia lonarensis]|uniref:Uncharacterized protein n=1 Tax=Cecembia lonarensis (strain CCUG 58316 / KCTC 22772 / LW9) TaxID=1225176 RepID=K1LX29_CECL9|nr:hypothetical protein [Cecembia lonarensis]EKB48714.1 hypothetical protein B879_02673 [Cecembia lonarensis LW9]